MTPFDPKNAFQRTQPQHAETLRGEVEKSYFHVSCSFTLAEMTASGATAEQLAGANIFIQTITGLAEKVKDVPKLPVKRLESYEPKPENK